MDFPVHLGLMARRRLAAGPMEARTACSDDEAQAAVGLAGRLTIGLCNSR